MKVTVFQFEGTPEELDASQVLKELADQHRGPVSVATNGGPDQGTLPARIPGVADEGQETVRQLLGRSPAPGLFVRFLNETTRWDKVGVHGIKRKNALPDTPLDYSRYLRLRRQDPSSAASPTSTPSTTPSTSGSTTVSSSSMSWASSPHEPSPPGTRSTASASTSPTKQASPTPFGSPCSPTTAPEKQTGHDPRPTGTAGRAYNHQRKPSTPPRGPLDLLTQAFTPKRGLRTQVVKANGSGKTDHRSRPCAGQVNVPNTTDVNALAPGLKLFPLAASTAHRGT